MDHNERDPDTGYDHDPTVDIVRQMIDAAQAVPAPAHPPAGPTTQHPGPDVTDATDPVARPPLPSAQPDDWDAAPAAQSWDTIYPDARDAYEDFESDYESGYSGDGGGEDGDGGEGVPNAKAGGVSRVSATFGRWAKLHLTRAGRALRRFLARPDAPRRLALGLLVIFVIAWPWKVLWVSLLVPLVLGIAWASIGSDGISELVARWHERLARRDPDQAETIRRRAATTSQYLTKALERLPETWTRGIYLPDFEPDGYVPEKLKIDPFEDLAAEVQAAKRTGGGA